jgi:hypothetical protein
VRPLDRSGGLFYPRLSWVVPAKPKRSSSTNEQTPIDERGRVDGNPHLDQARKQPLSTATKLRRVIEAKQALTHAYEVILGIEDVKRSSDNDLALAGSA